MTAAALTPDAQAYLDRYLRQVRAALRGHRAVDAEEVERDVIGHVNAELGERQEPVTVTSLRGVLERLGEPEEWIPADELPLWRRIVHRTRFGPEEWRLTYLTFALWAIGPLVGPIGPLFLIASFAVARATLALMHEHSEPVGARGWLIYPPLVLFYVPLAMALVIWPAPLLIAALEPVAGASNTRDSRRTGVDHISRRRDLGAGTVVDHHRHDSVARNANRAARLLAVCALVRTQAREAAGGCRSRAVPGRGDRAGGRLADVDTTRRGCRSPFSVLGSRFVFRFG